MDGVVCGDVDEELVYGLCFRTALLNRIIHLTPFTVEII
jgi:hypothetical protein